MKAKSLVIIFFSLTAFLVEAQFPQATEALRRSSDAVFVFFCALLMARYTAFFTTKDVPAETVASSLDEAGIAFGVAALLSLVAIAQRQDSTLYISVGFVLLTATLAGCGTLIGLIGVTFMVAGFICAALAAVATFQAVSSFAGLMGGIAGAIATGKMIGAGHVATGILAGVISSILLTALVVLVALVVGMCVAFTMVSFIGDDSSVFLNTLFVKIPTGICSGLGGGFAVWFIDSFVLQMLEGLKDLPDGFVGGSIFGLAIGFVLGANIGFSACFEQQARRNRVLLREIRDA